MKVVIDMNLSLLWAEYLRQRGHGAEHWSRIGRHDAEDAEIMEYCAAGGAIVFSGDLDFSTIHAMQRTSMPSILQLREQDALPAAVGPYVVRALSVASSELASGAIVTIKSKRIRISKLPIGRTDP